MFHLQHMDSRGKLTLRMIKSYMYVRAQQVYLKYTKRIQTYSVSQCITYVMCFIFRSVYWKQTAEGKFEYMRP